MKSLTLRTWIITMISVSILVSCGKDPVATVAPTQGSTTVQTQDTAPVPAQQQSASGASSSQASAERIEADLEKRSATVIASQESKIYTESTSYNTPGGMVDVEFVIATKWDTITSVNITKFADKPLSATNEKKFLEGARTQIVGKKLSNLPAFDRVGGASLTPQAFNEVVDRIQARAR